MPQDVPKWTVRQRHFMEWVATPEELRELRNLAAYCDANKIDRKTLWRWKRIPGFWEEVKAVTTQYMADSVPEVWASIKEMARRGSFPHQKMYFEMMQLYTPKSEQKTEGSLTINVQYADREPNQDDNTP